LIFRWTGWRKSEPSNFRRRSEQAPIKLPTGNALLLFKVKRQVRLLAKSTAKSANGEESPKLASEPRRGQFSGGPWAPDSGQMRVFRAAKQRIPKTEDSLAERGEFELPVPICEGVTRSPANDWSCCKLQRVSTLLASHEALEVTRATGLAQLAQRLGLDLSNAFARHRELLADLF
jgi:hypothetical protein